MASVDPPGQFHNKFMKTWKWQTLVVVNFSRPPLICCNTEVLWSFICGDDSVTTIKLKLCTKMHAFHARFVSTWHVNVLSCHHFGSSQEHACFDIIFLQSDMNMHTCMAHAVIKATINSILIDHFYVSDTFDGAKWDPWEFVCWDPSLS